MEIASTVNEKTSTLSKVEALKSNSQLLRGTLEQELADPAPNFSADSDQILKHHGAYQQDNRDQRRQGQRQYSFLVRTRLPGGKLTAAQLLTELELCDEVGDGTLRITDRQGLQLHGVVKQDLRETIQRINAAKLTTFGACGDVVRNLMCCPAPLTGSPVRTEMQSAVDELARHFALRSRAYHDIWLRDDEGLERVDEASLEVEPIYGSTYLPRKFKFAFALPDDNCTDALTHDVAFFALPHRNGELQFNVYVGGGMGVTPARIDTFPVVAKPLARISRSELVPFAQAVVQVQKEHGNRTDRKRARFKYLVADWGIDRIRDAVSGAYGKPLALPDEISVTGLQHHLGWHLQEGGKWFLGLSVQGGRIADSANSRLKSALRLIAQSFPVSVRLTPLQDLLLCDIDDGSRDTIEAILREHSVAFGESIPSLQQLAIACPALPTCGLAITEAERAMPAILSELQLILDELHLSETQISIRMTGCPNGCARPYVAEIALVGKAVDRYTLFLGGSVAGTRLAFKFREMAGPIEILRILKCLLGEFSKSRWPEERFGDFCFRLGATNLNSLLGDGSQN